jgi:hypothetical protein
VTIKLSNGFYSISGVDFADEEKFRIYRISPYIIGRSKVIYIMLDEDGKDTNVTVNVTDTSQEVWKEDGVTHRVGAPAVFYGDIYYHKGEDQVSSPRFVVSMKKWYNKGKLHREDGPAIESEDSTWVDEWWIHGVRVG